MGKRRLVKLSSSSARVTDVDNVSRSPVLSTTFDGRSRKTVMCDHSVESLEVNLWDEKFSFLEDLDRIIRNSVDSLSW